MNTPRLFLGSKTENRNGVIFVDGEDTGRTIRVGDVVRIRGDLRMSYIGGGKWKCSYLPEQLIDGKYLKHANEDRPWTGDVKGLSDDQAHVGSMWWGLDIIEVVRWVE